MSQWHIAILGLLTAIFIAALRAAYVLDRIWTRVVMLEIDLSAVRKKSDIR